MDIETPTIDFPFPGDHPFKGGENPYDDILLDWLDPHHLDGILAESYKEAADYLVEGLLTKSIGSGGCRERHFYPIAFLYRHSIELSLKNLVDFGFQMSALSDRSDSILPDLQRHNLHILWNLAKEVVLKTERDNIPDLAPVEKVILAFHAMDSTGFNFRYSHDKAGDVAIKNRKQRLDICNLKEVVDRATNFLDCSGYVVSQIVEYESQSY